MLQLPETRGNFNKISEAVDNFVNDYEREGKTRPLFAVIILNNRGDYPKFKSVFTKKGIMS
jgi:hypothetical protein